MYTLDDVRNMGTDIITPAIAADVLDCNPHLIRLLARNNPARLGFPVVVVGHRTKIPRKAFVRFMDGELVDKPKWMEKKEETL